MLDKRILITGANGMLGSKLVTYFGSQNEICAADLEPSIFNKNYTSYTIDLTDHNSVKRLIAEYKPEIIIHCAGLINVDQCESEPGIAESVNVKATKYLALSCSENTLFVYVSTDQVYGLKHSLTEDSTDLVQNNVYAKTKFEGEEAVRRICPKHIIARTNIFGWNMKSGRVSSAEWIINSIKSGQTIFLFNDYLFSPIYVGAFARILNGLFAFDYSGTVNIGASDYCSKLQFGEELVKVLGLDSKLIQSKSLQEHDFVAPRIPDMRMNTSLLSNMGLTPPTYKDSIIEFSQDNPNQA